MLQKAQVTLGDTPDGVKNPSRDVAKTQITLGDTIVGVKPISR